jgi:ClpP class serine protease
VVAVVDSLAASCGYWLAAQATDVVMTPSAQAGSIGVYTAHKNIAGALRQEGIEVTLVSAGKHKTEGTPFAPLSAEDRAALQRQVDVAYDLFINDVAAGRGVTADRVRAGFGEGRLLAAPDAVRAGLADRIDTLDHVLAHLASGKTTARVTVPAIAATDHHAARRAALDHAVRGFDLRAALLHRQ